MSQPGLPAATISPPQAHRHSGSRLLLEVTDRSRHVTSLLRAGPLSRVEAEPCPMALSCGAFPSVTSNSSLLAPHRAAGPLPVPRAARRPPPALGVTAPPRQPQSPPTAPRSLLMSAPRRSFPRPAASSEALPSPLPPVGSFAPRVPSENKYATRSPPFRA